MRRTFLYLTTTIVINIALLTNSYAVTPPASGDDPASSYDSEGDQTITQQNLNSNCTVYSPVSLTENHPVIVWGNGTGATPTSYVSLLRHWATWGFVVVAANTSFAGSGREMIDCLDSVYQTLGEHLSDKVGISGHSQGGGGSIMAGTDSRVDATAPIQPNSLGLDVTLSSHSQQNGPMLLLSGSEDKIVPPWLHQQQIFNNANVPVFWLNKIGAGHFEPSIDGGVYRGVTTAWFLYKLKDNTDAATLFEGSNCGFCDVNGWELKRKEF
jgi:dienelactone hydrolase